MASPSSTVAFGFSAHTGWAQAVAVGASLAAPKLLHRGRVDLSVGKESAHVFHAAAEMPLAAAKTYIERCRKRAISAAQAEMAALLKSLAPANGVIAVVVGNAKLPPLEAILKSHMLIHAAEGDFYRRAILDAAEMHKLRSVAVPSKELADAACGALNVSVDQLPLWLTTCGRSVGRPWGRDEKDAFLAACVALASV
jgi:hypothetical protein